MDNNTPKYASWVPTAGGYVADGKVVSTTPQYDEQGKFRVDVDRALFAQPQTQTQTTQVAAQPTSGITTANATGSAEDANATATGIGSLGSLSENTGKTTTGTLGTNATLSPVAGNTITNPLEQAQKDYDYMVATDNIQGQINALVKIGELTGQDYSLQINELAKQRSDKIQNMSNDYSQRYNEALANGDLETANQILEEQKQWLNSVNTPTQASTPEQQYELKQQELNMNWENQYRDGINQIANTILQLTGNLLNFQYNPYADSALQIAQGYAVGRVKETMNSTGMYYSSMTTSAITKAVAELVPVYEKMAKDELRSNISLLQSTANFLMNLEQSEFNMWKSQIELQWEANAEKRKEASFAIDMANARGYFNNEEAALLGVAPGTLSPNAREHLQELQEELDKENRSLLQNMVLADYKAELELERMEAQNKLNKDYYQYQVNNPKPSSSGSTPSTGLTYAQVLATTKAMVKGGASGEEVADYLNSSGLTYEQKNSILTNTAYSSELVNDLTLSQMQTNLKNMVGTYKPSEILDKAIEYAGNNTETRNALLNAISYAKSGDSELSGKIFDPRLLDQMGVEAYKEYVDYYTTNDGDALDMITNVDGLITALNNKYDMKQISAEEYDGLLDALNRNLIANQYIDKTLTTTKLGTDDSKKTKTIVDGARGVIDDYAEALYNSNAPSKGDYIADVYSRLVDKIGNTSEKFDYNWFPGNTGKASKTEAIRNIVYSVRDNEKFGKEIDPSIYSTVLGTANILAGQGKINEIDTKSKRSPEKVPIVL